MRANLIFVRQNYTPYGGAERFLAQAMESISTQGVDIEVVCRKWTQETKQRHTIINPWYMGRRSRDAGFKRAVCDYIREQSGALVQSHERIPCCDIYRAGDGVHREWLRQRARKRGSMDAMLSRFNPYHRYVLAAEEYLFTSPRLKAVICNSRMVKNEILHYFDLPSERLHVIHSGVDANHFHPRLRNRYRIEVRRHWGVPSEAPLFLFVGSGFERKGLEAAIRALPGQAWLMVVGKDRATAGYQRLAKVLKINDRIVFCGAQQQVAPFYGAADTLVLPTLYDPFPNVVLEAMAAGLPVVTSSKSGASDIIEAGVNGYTCDALDIGKLRNHLQSLLDGSRVRVMGEAARSTVEEMTLELMTNRYLALYQTLLEPHR